MKDINTANIHKLDEMIAGAHRIGIVTHIKPDGDALGSATGLWYFLNGTGKTESCIFLPGDYQHTQDFLLDDEVKKQIVIYEGNENAAEARLLDCDLIICCDFPAFHRAGGYGNALKMSKATKILIDHHLSPDREAFGLSFSETEVSSTSEFIYFILKSLLELRNEEARLPLKSMTSLMTGMTTDTNNFANSVKPTTLLMASELIAAGVDRDAILCRLYNNFSESRTRLLGHILKDLLTVTTDGVAYIILDKKTLKEYNVHEGDTEGFVNKPLEIAKVRMSILCKEDEHNPGEVRVSIRSKAGVSANNCSRLYFNGGGHEQAAGGKLYMDITEVPAYIEEKTHIYFNDENE